MVNSKVNEWEKLLAWMKGQKLTRKRLSERSGVEYNALRKILLGKLRASDMVMKALEWGTDGAISSDRLAEDHDAYQSTKVKYTDPEHSVNKEVRRLSLLLDRLESAIKKQEALSWFNE